MPPDPVLPASSPSPHRRRRLLRILTVGVVVVVLGLSVLHWWTRHGAGAGSPRIGLSVSDDWYDDVGVHRVAYDVALARAGARVVSLRPSDHAGDIGGAVATLDGLVLAGGGDVHPSFYGGGEVGAAPTDRARDRFEIDLIRAARRRGLPILGICRGCQVLAVAHGGTLRDLGPAPAEADRHGPALESLAAHEVTVEPTSRLARLIEPGPHRVNSFHAQAVDDPGTLRVVARADDGVVEAVELPGPDWVLGIQWHPELQGILDDTQQAIVAELVRAARERSSRTGE